MNMLLFFPFFVAIELVALPWCSQIKNYLYDLLLIDLDKFLPYSVEAHLVLLKRPMLKK